MSRGDGRAADELRPIEIELDFIPSASGSALFEIGSTRLICTAMVEESVPPWMRGRGTGWVTSEYGMLPGSTSERKSRDASRGRVDGRTVEIQRLVGRSLRSVVDFRALGERTAWIDCDVIQADGGTRTASISGAWVALRDCIEWMRAREMIVKPVLSDHVAAVSAGIYRGQLVLDLDYAEDSEAEVDGNFVMTGSGGIVEVQSTAEGAPFSEAAFGTLMSLARGGIVQLIELQKLAVL